MRVDFVPQDDSALAIYEAHGRQPSSPAPLVERELWKGLSEYKWSHYPKWSDPRQEVNLLKEKLVAKFAQYA